MAATILSVALTLVTIIFKWLAERKVKRKLDKKELADFIYTHQEQRENAGQTALDWRKSLDTLKAKIAKKKKQDTQPTDKKD